MGKIPTVKVENPSNADEFIVINESDYREDIHTLWEESGAETEGSGEEAGEGDTGADESTDDTGADELPEGYTLEHEGGGYYRLFGPEGQLIEGPSNGKWQGKDAALLGAQDHAEG